MYFIKEFYEGDGTRLYVGIRKEMKKIRDYILKERRFMGRDIAGLAGLEVIPKGTVLAIELREGVDGLFYTAFKDEKQLGLLLFTRGLDESNRWDTVSFEELATQTY